MILSAIELCKTLGGRRVLDRVSLSCHGGEITVLTGANGAGKSTLLRILAGVMAPDRGAVDIAGESLARRPRQARRRLGYLPEKADPPGYLTGDELLEMVRTLKRAAPLAAEIRAALAIDAVSRQRIERLSLGERRRMCVAAALVGDPDLLVLDEPTNGLDVAGTTSLGDLLAQRRAAGAAILIATHDADFADCLADVRLHLDAGRLVDRPVP